MKSHQPCTKLISPTIDRRPDKPAGFWQFIVLALLALGLAAVVTMGHEVAAQTQAMGREMSAALPDIKAAIVRVTAYPAAAVSVRGNNIQLIVALSNTSTTSAAERDKEATHIADAIARQIEGNAAFREMQGLHIDYVVYSPQRSDVQLLDAIDFRKDPLGKFILHRS
jgi:hypothetical protein